MNNPIEQLTFRNSPDSEDLNRRDIFTRSLSVRADTIDEATRSVEAVLSTEGQVAVFDYRRYEVIDEVLLTSGMEPVRQLPLLQNHARYSLDDVIGSIRNIRIENNQVIGRLFFAENDDVADRAWNKVKQGHLTDVSAGYRASDNGYVDIAPNTTQIINGKSYTAGARTLRITHKWSCREGSLVPIGADQAAKLRKELGDEPAKERNAMNKKLKKYLQTLGLRADATDAQATAFIEGLSDEHRAEADKIRNDPNYEPATQRSAPAPAPAPASPAPAENAAAPAAQPSADQIRSEAVRLERDRVSRLRDLGRSVSPDLLQRAIDEGWTVERFSTTALESMRESRQAPVSADESGVTGVHRHEAEGNDLRSLLSAGLILRGGMDFRSVRVANPSMDPEQLRRQQEQMATRAQRYQYLSIPDLCRAALQANGRSVPVHPDEMIRSAISTGSLQVIFTDSINASSDMGFADYADTTRSWTEEGEAANFQTQTDITLGKTTGMEKLPRGGTAAHATLDGESETYKVARYAEKFVIDEQDLIDDNMGVLTEVPREMAEEAASLRPSLVYAILLSNPDLADSVALFHTSHNNTITTALGLPGLNSAVVKMINQTKNGRAIDVRARHLIVPGDLEFTAAQLVESTEVRESVAANGTKNPAKRLNLNLVSDPRIGVNGVVDPSTGTAHVGTATNWFLVGSRRTVKVVYRRGTGRRPQVQPWIRSEGSWGLGFAINLDIAAYARDFRSMVRSTGAG